MYVKDIESGVTVSDKEPVILKESLATAFVDGQNVLGPVVGNFCMDLAINKAKRSGVGWVVAKGESIFYYRYIILDLNPHIKLSLCNFFPLYSLCTEVVKKMSLLE